MATRHLIASLGTLAAAAGPGLAQTFTFLEAPAGASFTLPRGVSNGGAVVVGQASMAGSTIPWRWTAASGTVNLGYIGFAMGVSADGNVVVGTQGINPGQAVRWTSGGGLQGLGFVNPAHTNSNGRAVSADGSVLVGTSFLNPSQSLGYRWTQVGGMTSIGVLTGYAQSNATGVSGDGFVTVGTSYNYIAGGGYPEQAYRHVQGVGMVGLGFLPGRNASAATTMSADGTTVIGGSYTVGIPGSDPFVWNIASGMQFLGALPGYSSCQALGISGDGSIVVGFCSGAASTPFIWTPAAGMRSLSTALVSEFGLNLNGWQLTSAYAISPDGKAIVGTAAHPTGPFGVYLVTLPTPCYSNCDASTMAPILNVNDFQCFLNKFAASDSFANCDHSTTAPTLNVNDFQCFLNAYAAGCS